MTDFDTQVVGLTRFIRKHPRLVVLTGAGVSHGSGIPTYRDANGQWKASEPIKHQEFIGNAQRRQRYWARSMRGWPAVSSARPNAAHLALARLEQVEPVQLLITQNVDRLHQRAGSRQVVDLHGRLDKVVCLDCHASYQREQLQQQLERDNPNFHGELSGMLPDGDADVPDAVVDNFCTPSCDECGGTLMPDVVFFGGTVPRDRVTKCTDAIDNAQALLVVGSSLQVYSGFRFCRRAAEQNKPIAIINPGATRADSMAAEFFSADCGPLLQAAVANLQHFR